MLVPRMPTMKEVNTLALILLLMVLVTQAEDGKKDRPYFKHAVDKRPFGPILSASGFNRDAKLKRAFGHSIISGKRAFGTGIFRGKRAFGSGIFGGKRAFGSGIFGGKRAFGSGIFGGKRAFGSGVIGKRAFGSGILGGKRAFGFGSFKGKRAFGSRIFGGKRSFESDDIFRKRFSDDDYVNPDIYDTMYSNNQDETKRYSGPRDIDENFNFAADFSADEKPDDDDEVPERFAYL